MMRCPRAGCAGTVDEDGFCDVCGLEAIPGDAVSGPQSRASARTGASSSSDVRSWTAASSSSNPVSSRSGSSGRGMLGVGLIEVPPVPYRDPSDVVLDNPVVPERQRFCGRCGAEVGRSRGERPGRASGFCPKCGQKYSFMPALKPGQVAGDQYEVLGCLAHGGLGWIYLARDQAVSGRWVVLKGVIDGADADATAAAIAERHFLAKVEHPNIVKIHNFVQLGDDESTVGYIVMEYVGGQSLKDLLKQCRIEQGPTECLPVEQAIAYAIEVLRPLGYLHANGLLYCDVKPDNVIQTQEQLKLIDLGAVRHSDDDTGAVFGTEGYQAPEVSDVGPSPAADLYAVGRMLAVLSIPFDFRATYVDRLPSQAEAPLLAEHESLLRLLSRACHPDPKRRFDSAVEMAEQLTCVLREVLSAADGQPRPASSANFGPELESFGTAAHESDVVATVDGLTVARALPVPRVDGSDPAAGLLTALGSASPADLLDEVKDTSPTVEVRLRRVRAHIELGDIAAAWFEAEETPAKATNAWRVHWAKGIAALAADKPFDARRAFDAVVDLLPGELVAKLALAAAAELSGDLSDAARYYGVAWRTDRSLVSAAFGLARVLLADGARTEAVAVLSSVPTTSASYVAAQEAAIRAVANTPNPVSLTSTELVAAGHRLGDIEIGEARRARLEADLLETALNRAFADGPAAPDGSRVLGCRLEEDDLRLGLEQRYRTLARHSASVLERYAYVDRANQVRPWTWV
ncbi:MAG: protein kinase [Actinophytocola sp.]|nr:protein kinase [Actinophytocola sp.]